MSGLHNIYVCSDENPMQYYDGYDDCDDINENPGFIDSYNNDSYEKNYIEGMDFIYNFMKKIL
jgi:hypothetical protein